MDSIRLRCRFSKRRSFAAPQADLAEAEAAAETFGSEDRREPLVLSSVMGQIGHTLGTCGMASVLKATLEMERGQVPKTAGLASPIASVTSHADVLCVADQPRKLYATAPGGKTVVDVVNSTSTGLLYHALLEGGENLPEAPVKRKPEIRPATTFRTVRLAAPTRDVLFQELSRVAVNTEALFQTGGNEHFNGKDGVRLAVLAEDASALTKKLRLAMELAAKPGSRMALEQNGVFLQEVAQAAPRIAFLFPGQGSQYAGMLKELVAEVPAAAEKVREINEVLARLGHGRFEDICWNQTERLGGDVWTTQLAMLLADTVMHHALISQGIRPDVVCGHSYGEIPALVAAGSLTLEDAIRLTEVRTKSVESFDSTRGSLLSTTADIDTVEACLKQLPGGCYVASHNAPDQTVVGGTIDAVNGMKRLLESEGFGCKILPVPRPYHTPLLIPAQQPFAAALSAIDFRAGDPVPQQRDERLRHQRRRRSPQSRRPIGDAGPLRRSGAKTRSGWRGDSDRSRPATGADSAEPPDSGGAARLRRLHRSAQAARRYRLGTRESPA